MIKSAINRILELAAPNVVTCNGISYVDKPMKLVEQELQATPLEVMTLRGLIDYIKDDILSLERKKELNMIHVVSPTEVRLMSLLDKDRERETLVVAKAQPPQIPFGRFISNEAMLITVQSMFVDDPETDKAEVLRFAGTVTAGTIKEYNDDGVTQKAIVKKGIASKENRLVPSPCLLRPHRTFFEVEQPSSQFIFRLKEGLGDSVEAALFESDGGAWKMDAMRNIKFYLQNELEGVEGITIIA